MVNSVSLGVAFLANAQQQERELIRQNFNHPAILCWSMFNEITLRNVYEGVDLRLYSSENGILEFDWIVAKAQDYGKIRLALTGQELPRLGVGHSSPEHHSLPVGNPRMKHVQLAVVFLSEPDRGLEEFCGERVRSFRDKRTRIDRD